MTRHLTCATALTLLAGCAADAPMNDPDASGAAAAPAAVLADGTYRIPFQTGCATLTLGPNDSYRWDADCDGSIDYVADNVRVSGETIRMDQARLDITSVTDTGFTGTFWLRGDRTDVTGTAV